MASGPLPDRDPEGEATRAASVVLQGFLDAYFVYEEGASLRHRVVKRAGRELSPAELDAEIERRNSEWDEMFQTFCTPRKRAYVSRGGWRRVPDGAEWMERIYDAHLVRPGRVEIDVEQHPRIDSAHKRYVLLRKGNRWLVDSVQRESGDGTFTRAIL